jgi:tetratricopeptide (TPR) repeat protein
MLRAVAYEMIAKQERWPRHLAAAEHLRTAFPNDGEDVAEVIAAHLFDAFRASPGNDAELRASAIAALRRAAQRAAAVGSPDAAERSLRNALELAVDDTERAQLTEEAGRMAINSGRSEAAFALLQQAADAHAAGGRDREAARLAAPMGVALGRLGRNEEAISRMRAALETLGSQPLDPDVAELNWGLGRALIYTGDTGEAEGWIERALDAAEGLEQPALLCRALELKAIHSVNVGRFEQAGGLFDRAAAIADRHRLPIRGNVQSNAADLHLKRDLPDAVETLEAALTTSRELGQRSLEAINLGNLIMAQLLAGRWQEAERIGLEAMETRDADRSENEDVSFGLGLLYVRRGEIQAARAQLSALEAWERGDDIEARHLRRGLAGVIALADDELEPAIEVLAATAREAIALQGGSADGARLAWPEAIRATLSLGRLDEAEQLLGLMTALPRGQVAPLLRAEVARTEALLAGARGDQESAKAKFAEAISSFEALAYPFWLARTQVDHGGWLLADGQEQEAAPVLAEAAATLERLGAEPELARARRLLDGSDLDVSPDVPASAGGRLAGRSTA